jgi:hypothetical protein
MQNKKAFHVADGFLFQKNVPAGHVEQPMSVRACVGSD